MRVLPVALLLACAPAPDPGSPLPADTLAPAGVLTLTHTPLVVGEDVTIRVAGATPNTDVYLFRSSRVVPGGFCPGAIAPVCMDLAPRPTLVFTMRANAQGVATTTFRFPDVPATSVAMQAGYVTSTGADTSNAVDATIYRDLIWDPADPVPRGPSTRVDCGVALPPATTGTCDVAPGSSGATLLRGDVLTPSTTFAGGEVLIDAGGTITCTGCDCSGSAGASTATVVTCADAAISPAPINAHDHITFSQNAPLTPSSTRYDHRHGWRGSVSTPQNTAGTGGTSAGTRWVEVRNLMAGTTTMAGSGAATGMLRNPDRNLDEGLSLADVEYETFPLSDSNEQFRADCQWNYSLSERDAEAEDHVLSHVSEGIDFYAAEEFRCQATSFDGGQDLTQPNITHVHGIGLQAVDYWEMARNDTELVWSPRSNLSLYGHTANVRLLASLGGTIGLGTDWTYTGSMNILRELACADDYNRTHLDGFFSDADLWRMATLANARALGAGDQLGALVPGFAADITIFDGATAPEHRAVLDATPDAVALVLRGGEPLYGEADTLTQLGATCDAVSVCGASQAVCVGSEFGTTFAALSSAAGAYPAFFCGTPTHEPTCTPSRPGEFTGIPSAGDTDGDGIANSSDNCPRVFNPIRPIDGGLQPDADGDGIGDACDGAPLPRDLDGDGVPNFSDTCPTEPGPQTDSDGDGTGDVCDFCPTTANPGTVCPPAMATIPDARTVLPLGSAVSVRGVVTATTGNGFTMQDPSVAGGAHAGIFVYTGGSPGVLRGDDVRVDGSTSEYFGELQLDTPAVTLLGTAPEPTPVVLTLAQAVTETYEGVLVTVDGPVTNAAYDCVVDGASCADPGLWEIGGASGVLVYDRTYEDADWAANIGNTPVTGVMTYRFSRRRITPRDTTDL